MNKLKVAIFVFLINSLLLLGVIAWMLRDIDGLKKQIEEIKEMKVADALEKGDTKTSIKEKNRFDTSFSLVGTGANISLNAFQQKLISVIQQATPSVVNIIITKNLHIFLMDPFDFRGIGNITREKRQVGGGSGIIISEDGLIITNKHVVNDANAEYSVVLSDGTIYTVQNIWFDPLIDIAVLQIVDKNGKKPSGLQPASFLDFNEDVYVGQFAIAIGNALAEYQNSVSFGIISATNRQLESNNEKSLYIGLYQTDTPINPGNSGGPLLDIQGRVIGINTAINAAGEGIGFALPVNKQFVNATIQSIKREGKIKRPFLGVGYIDLTKKIAEELGLSHSLGAYVKQVVAGSPAEKAGILEGDIIISINNRPVTKNLPFLYHIYQHSPNDVLNITLIRGGEKKEVTATLASQ